MPSEDGMGSVLGAIGGTEEAANEDLQWKRNALKKFHKVWRRRLCRRGSKRDGVGFAGVS